MRYYIGIDYSISSPAFTIYDSQEDSFKSYFFNSYKTKSFHNLVDGIYELPYPINMKGVDKYSTLAHKVLDVIENYPKLETIIAVEGYAFGAKGKTFHIAENTGTLKYVLSNAGYTILDDLKLFAPSQIKKFATGKGVASKQQMLDAYVDITGENLHQLMQHDKDINSSFVADIVDSWFIARFLHKVLAN